MARLIDADEVVNKLYSDKRAMLAMDMNSSARNLQAIIRVIEDAPTIDIVRCKECKYREKNHYCVEWGQPYLCNDECYCSYGERKESE